MTWDDHKKNFARLARDGGYTIAQYAAEFNLNPNTARRYLRAFKEDTRTADSRKPNKPVRKPLKSMIIRITLMINMQVITLRLKQRKNKELMPLSVPQSRMRSAKISA